jgi:hypothetical protein
MGRVESKIPGGEFLLAVEVCSLQLTLHAGTSPAGISIQHGLPAGGAVHF